jgi:hypothetical protein
MYKPTFQAKRITRTYRQTIHAVPEAVFPLLCPVREAEWLAGWRYAMIYSESGVVERVAVFSTPGDGEEQTTWIVTKHDPKTYEIEFTRFTPNSRTCILTIVVKPKDEKSSSVDISYAYTALSPAGNNFIDHFTEGIFLKAVTFWEKSMNHFLKTGVTLKAEHNR